MFSSFRRGVGLVAFAVLALPLLSVQADDPAKPKQPDRPKAMIEKPAKDLVVRSTTPSKDDASNPHVEPGKVQWHKTLADACAASAKSKKPVLLFQMLGKLDDQFC
jgi:hypothetical protein